jgi:hypothetical protein
MLNGWVAARVWNEFETSLSTYTPGVTSNGMPTAMVPLVMALAQGPAGAPARPGQM